MLADLGRVLKLRSSQVELLGTMLRRGRRGFTVSGLSARMALSKGGVFKALREYERREWLRVARVGTGTWDQIVYVGPGAVVRAILDRKR